jgi:general secretion pathway protein M
MNALSNLPTGRRGHVVALGLLLLVIMVVWGAIVSPLIDLYGDRAEQLSKRETFAAHMARLAEQLPALHKRAENTAHAGPPPTLVLEGPSDAVAAATLQNRVQEMATSAGTSLVSVENVAAEPAGAYHRIGLKVSLNASWSVLIALLHSVEQATPPMLIDDVQIHGSPLPMLNNNRGLEANFTIYALRAGAAAERKP